MKEPNFIMEVIPPKTKEKAFDSIEHEAVLKALRTIGITEIYVAIPEDIYTGAYAKEHMDNQVSLEILVLRGVKQGDPMFPKVFTATIQEGLRRE